MRSRGVIHVAVCAGFDDRFDDMDAWLRGRDSNPGPIGYEPIELPLLHPAPIHPLAAPIQLYDIFHIYATHPSAWHPSTHRAISNSWVRVQSRGDDRIALEA